jgi:endonuclease/exonuclease/phosphatase family metal-dependent hydrolase
VTGATLRGVRAGACLALAATLASCAAHAVSPPAELRVLVYNIHAGKDAGGVDNLERVAALVRETRADVVLLQEVDRLTTRSGNVDQLRELERGTGYHGAFGRTLDYQGGEYGIALLSRWPIVHDTLVPLRIDPPQQRAGGSYEPRGMLAARVAMPGRELRVINTHLDASRDDHYRRQEVAHVAAKLDSLAGAGGGLAIAGGDFNAEPGTATHRAMTEGGVRDAWSACGDGGTGFSFPASGPVKRIDYLFIANAAECVSARVLVTEASDHRPLLVTLRP